MTLSFSERCKFAVEFEAWRHRVLTEKGVLPSATADTVLVYLMTDGKDWSQRLREGAGS